MMNQTQRKISWSDVVLGLFFVAMGIFFLIVGIDIDPSEGANYKTKLGALLITFLNKIGGKWTVFFILNCIGVWKIYKGFKKD